MPSPLPAIGLWTVLLAGSASACGACRPSIRTLILTPEFPARLASLLAPIAILLAIGALVHARKENTHGPP